MENWREHIKYGDISKACKKSGVTNTVYYDSQKISSDKWTDGMLSVNESLREIVTERIEKMKNYA